MGSSKNWCINKKPGRHVYTCRLSVLFHNHNPIWFTITTNPRPCPFNWAFRIMPSNFAFSPDSGASYVINLMWHYIHRRKRKLWRQNQRTFSRNIPLRRPLTLSTVSGALFEMAWGMNWTGVFIPDFGLGRRRLLCSAVPTDIKWAEKRKKRSRQCIREGSDRHGRARP